jgi:hypothetical protein
MPTRVRRLHLNTGKRLLLAACCASAQAASSDAPEHPLLKGCASAAPACAEVLEAHALKAHASVARRSGHQLWVTVIPGLAPLPLSDLPADALVYRYLGPLPGTDLHLVVQIPQHGAPRYVPLGPGMAGTVRFNAPPWPSPDGRWLAVAVAASGGQVGQLALWGRVGPQWRMQYSFDPDPGMGFEFRGWRADGAAMRLAWQCPKQSGATQLRDGPYGWDLVPPPPAHCGD